MDFNENDKNPYIFLLFLILVMILSVNTVSASAAGTDWICSDDEIKKYEEMGLSQDNSLYVLLDGTVYSIGSTYDNVISFDSKNLVISTDSNYFGVAHWNENGHLMVDETTNYLELSKYSNKCILDINDSVMVDGLYMNSIPSDNSVYKCMNSSNKIESAVCAMLYFTSIIIRFLTTNVLTLSFIGVGICSLCFGIFKKNKGVIR